ncbi:diheme cytochrome c [Inmirania thermothiophila]|uniref:Diheme cytochrome c n=1 Tax=Inmirania thermothiophila TaxID=1750597 RepID=A0A3N1YAI4_9GAMM|nr:diheme cytochrome c [Inmirania thermothiophila]ROR34642.1 diheme cytochrome c [Inmirania thermothiophila]
MRYVRSALIVLAALAATAGALRIAAGEDGWRRHRPDLPPATDRAYVEECGACHMAYPPALLTAAEWARIMDRLDAHFGDDASLDPATAARVRAYLEAHAGDRRPGVRARRRPAPATADGLPRITTTRYFLRKHDEVRRRWVVENPEVGSFANCPACHTRAAQGLFDEDDVRIPGHGRWEDD